MLESERYIKYLALAELELYNLRARAIEDELSFLDRLTGKKSSGDAAQSGQGPSFVQLGLQRVRNAAHACRRFFGNFWATAKVLPKILAQVRRIRQLESRGGDVDALILAVASNRLCLLDENESPREYFTYITKPLGSRGNNEVGDLIRAAEHIFIADPLSISQLWPFSRKLWDENIYVADGLFLAVHSLVEFMAKPVSIPASLKKIFARSSDFGRHRLQRRLRSAFIVCIDGSMRRLFGAFRQTKTILFTSNSLLTEILRVGCIASGRCSLIVELVHGIGTLENEIYLARIISHGAEWGAEKKFYIVPLVPGLPLFGCLKSQLRYSHATGINPYLRQYILRQLRAFPSAEAWLDHEFARINSYWPGQRNPVIISLFGNTTETKEQFLETPSFLTEYAMLKQINALAKERGREIILLYTLHPRNKLTERLQKVLADAGATYHPSSMSCYLFSQCCLSLVSSSLFEANYFGARAMTPATCSDNFFTKEFLDLLSYPADAQEDTMKSCLRKFMLDALNDPAVDVPARAKNRLAMMVG